MTAKPRTRVRFPSSPPQSEHESGSSADPSQGMEATGVRPLQGRCWVGVSTRASTQRTRSTSNLSQRTLLAKGQSECTFSGQEDLQPIQAALRDAVVAHATWVSAPCLRRAHSSSWRRGSAPSRRGYPLGASPRATAARSPRRSPRLAGLPGDEERGERVDRGLAPRCLARQLVETHEPAQRGALGCRRREAWPEWRNGRRSRLKPGGRKAWGFESLLRHQAP